MNLYVIRHAEAAPRDKEGGEDADRPLTDAGRAQCQHLAQTLQRRGVQLEVIVHSPLLRAHQTAEEIAKHWAQPAPQLQPCDELEPGLRPKKLARWLMGLDEANVAIVGHEPDLSEFIGWLIGSRQAQLDMVKAGVAAITCEGSPSKGAGTLQWLVTPEWMGEATPAPSHP